MEIPGASGAESAEFVEQFQRTKQFIMCHDMGHGHAACTALFAVLESIHGRDTARQVLSDAVAYHYWDGDLPELSSTLVASI